LEDFMSESADVSTSDTLMDVSSSYAHLACFRNSLPLIVRTNQHTYISTRDPSDPLGTTWLALALEGMENLCRRAHPVVRSVAIIGTGGGLDAIGLSHLCVPEQIVASDIHPRALEAARWNIARYACRKSHCQVVQSDLFREYPGDSSFDLIYENLPNVPEGADLLDGIRAASCYSPDCYCSDPAGDRYLLTLHYNCLLQARDHLRSGGWIVAMIGGRVPWPVIEDLFARAGFRATVLHFGLKTQTEPGVVLDGYARAERNGSPPFTYYHPVEACSGILARHLTELADPSDLRVEELNARLEPYRVSAGDALQIHRRGERVCHSVYAVGGTAVSSPGPQP
jgi:SAM-dependent methyltransferase